MTAVLGFETLDRLENGVSLSRQRALLPREPVERSEAGARRLGATYWLAVQRSTLGAVRARWGPAGGSLRLFGLLPLFRFGPEEARADAGAVTYRCAILGGILAARAGGHVLLEQRAQGEGAEIVATVSGYRPRTPSRLHCAVQRPFHLAVSRRWLRSLAR